ncbi:MULTISPECIES: nitronate monooxygenase [Pseudobutyrivibrio]|uniref:Probable nitronate monooxygenase n=1 Tax=Pseudobutyrivibrio xylanivorans TaxID=185007 RepID=A0A1G5RYQ4_PSEXY|nr:MULTISPECIES: nitronate monooxygenase [Pseudobutyrivibrio]MDC7280232.1 nitronate monooxygenase [Butyrivibrio fibrisolvens]SCZ79126.1 enoyl-[acyl-carrier protein] reductase II [Pseudobutyrivibrio xylanivorans]
MKLNDLTGTKYPIIQGGMANIATGEFAAAVSNAGALGLVASGGMNAEQLREQIKICKSLTNKPFGVNLMLMNPDVDNIAKMLIEEKVQFITTGAGNPGKYMEGWKSMGAKVFPVVASVALAKMMVRAGADAIIAEGGESGGHVGDMTTMTLLPQVVAAVDVPVIAAGGIANGKQMAAALLMGACGVQIGTCLLVSEECPIHENYKQALIKAKDNSTTVTGRSQGAPVRVIKNEMAREYLKLEAEGAGREDLERMTLGSLRKAVVEGDTVHGSLMAGQTCGQLTRIRPAVEILDEMYVNAKKTLHSAGNIAI